MKMTILALSALVLLGGGCAASSATSQGSRTPAIPTAKASAPPAALTYTGLDAHDGTLIQVGPTYYLYGTRYGCGFTWGVRNTPWCGFGVWTSSDAQSWVFQRLLFDPASTNTWWNESWQATCGSLGTGCFNPRMVQRSDGVWILWFNAPGDYQRIGANAYYALGCAGLAGPCGPGAGQYGSLHKPSLYTCSGNGDFSILADGANAYIACTEADSTLAVEQLDVWWTNGSSAGARNLAGLTNAESPGLYHASNGYLLTYSDPNCGYCSGTGTGYAWATAPLGPYRYQANPGTAAPATGARDLSSFSCGGQPRSLAILNGQPYEWIDLWNGANNETTAAIHLEPVVLTPNAIATFTCQGVFATPTA